MVELEKNPWVSSEQQIDRVEIDGKDLSIIMPELSVLDRGDAGFEAAAAKRPDGERCKTTSDWKLGVAERAFSAAGAAFLSAIIVNPLDVAKTRLQAQAAGVPYSHPLSNITSRMAFFGPTTLFADLRCSPSCTRAGIHGTVSICPPDCFQYKGTLDVFGKIIRQEGFARLWRGTNAGLALAVPTVGIYLPCYDIFRNWLEEFTARHAPSTTAFKVMQNGAKPPGVLKTLLNVVSQVKTTSNNAESNLRGYRVLWTGMGAQLARDVPYSAICWATLELVGIVEGSKSIVGELRSDMECKELI